ncbi:unnamed protein product [Aphis gossypii]|uniref:Uncharacterized protein n=1 Tax=Aphis gossypii TaxID=80765 RepID=A0A9P0IN63_APHGO|nr:unnamed protein product [Aphis gossypii]
MYVDVKYLYMSIGVLMSYASFSFLASEERKEIFKHTSSSKPEAKLHVSRKSSLCRPRLSSKIWDLLKPIFQYQLNTIH